MNHSFLRSLWNGPARDLLIAALLLVVVPLIVAPYVYQDFPTLRSVGGKGWSPDEGTVLHNAERLRQGDVLYSQYFDFKGPIGLLPFVIAFGLDEASITSGRVAMFLVLGLLSAVMYLAARRVCRQRTVALCVAALIPFVAWPCWPFAYQDLLGAVFTVGAVPLLLDGTTRRSALAGVLVGAALWTSLSHGGPALVAFSVCIGFRAYVRGNAREVLRSVGVFLAGASGLTLAVWLWFASHGALGALLWCTFVFPFEHYMAPINVVAYGFDAQQYIDAWQRTNAVDGALAIVLCRSALWLPKLAVVVSTVIGLAVIAAAFRRARRRTSLSEEETERLFQLAVPAALGAVALPVVLGWTRADLGHIGFVIPESVLASCALLRPVQSAARAFRVRHFAHEALRLAVFVLAASACWFHVRQLDEPYERIDPDVQARETFDVESLEIWTRPGDEIVSPIYGGYTFLVSGRRNATRFATLWRDLATYQWRVAANDIVKRRPKVLRASSQHVERLIRIRPEILRMYTPVGQLYVRRDLLGPWGASAN